MAVCTLIYITRRVPPNSVQRHFSLRAVSHQCFVLILPLTPIFAQEYGPREYEDNRLVRPRKIDEHKIEMIPVLSDYDDDTADGDGNGADHNSRTLNKFGNPSGPFKHTV